MLRVARSRADWLVGMNLSRAYSLADNEKLSVGRVQTPTLAMVVERELAIRQFVPEEYLEIVADFRPSEGSPTGDAQQNLYRGTWFRAWAGEGADKESRQKAMRLPTDGKEAKRIIERAHAGWASIDSIQSETQRMAPPLFYDLTELQRHANRRMASARRKRWMSRRRCMKLTSSSAIRAPTADTSRRMW
jgi:DNA topoisomerase III